VTANVHHELQIGIPEKGQLNEHKVFLGLFATRTHLYLVDLHLGHTWSSILRKQLLRYRSFLKKFIKYKIAVFENLQSCGSTTTLPDI
jgi:hypothetical protein